MVQSIYSVHVEDLLLDMCVPVRLCAPAPLRVLLVLSSARFRLSLWLPPVESESRGIRPLLHGLLPLLREHHHHLRQRPKLLHHLE